MRQAGVKKALARFARMAIPLGLALSGCRDATPTAPPEADSSVIAATALSTNDAGTYPAGVAMAWVRLSMDLTREESLSPPRAARIWGYLGVTLWESVVSGVPGGRSLEGQLNGLTGIPHPMHSLHWPAVASAALAEIMRHFYTSPSSLRAINDLEGQLRESFRVEAGAALYGRSQAQGRAVAAAIRQWSRTDGYSRYAGCAWTPPSGPGYWVPTPPAWEDAVEPCWGELRPFVLPSAGVCAPSGHPAYSEAAGSPFHSAAMEVFETVNNVTPEQVEIARYWADPPGETATPPGHSMSIAAQALELTGARLDLAAETFARVGIGEADAFISCWASKYHYSLVRPITYINQLIDADWQPIIETPPFPAYTSGHSNDAGASSTILTALFGDPFAFTDHTHVSRGFEPRSFGSFADAATESAFSRLYGGIHYRFDITEGLTQGRWVGRAVNALEFRTAPAP